jgi:hypothetical protein
MPSSNLYRIVRSLIFTVVLFQAITIQAQLNTPASKPVQRTDSLLQKIAEQYKVHLYYNPIWFKGFKGPLQPKPTLEQTIAEICRNTRLSFIRIDSLNIVFVPDAGNDDNGGTSINNGLRVVGSKAEYGRFSKGRIRGKVFDGSTNSSLPGVTVTDDKTGKSVVTDVKGSFEMILPVGKHCFTLNFFGYRSSIDCFELAGDGTMDFELFYKSFQLKEAVITGTRADNNITSTNTGSFRLDAKTVKQLPGFMGEHDLVKSLTLLPGIQSTGEFGSGFVVHGGGTDQNLFLLEGIPLYSTSHLFGLISALNPDVISSVSIYKSGIPARFGERISSVTDISTGAENPDKLMLKGGIGLINSRLKLETPIANSHGNIILAARGSYSDWMLHMLPDIDLKNSNAGFYDVNGQANYMLNARNTLSFSGYYSRDNFTFSSNTNYKYSNLVASVRWTFLVSKKLISAFTAGLSDYKLSTAYNDSLKKLTANQVDFGLKYKALKWKLTWLPGSGHTIDAGADGILYHNQPGILKPLTSESAIKPVVLEPEKAIEAAVYIADNWEITPLLSVEAGFRLSQYAALGPGSVLVFEPGLPRSTVNITDTLHYQDQEVVETFISPEPRLSFRYILNEKSSVKFGFQLMSQYINLISNTAVASPTDAWKLSSTNFKPVSATQFSVGYYRNLHGNMFETSLEGFFKKQSNAIGYKNGAQILLNPHLETDLLAAEGQSYGIEMYIKKTSGRLTGWISYTWSRSMHRTSGIYEEEMINGNQWFPSNFDTPHNLTITASYRLSGRWLVSSVFSFNSGRPLTLPEQKYEVNGTQIIVYSDRNKYRLPDYHRLDVSLTLEPGLRLGKRLRGSWTFSILNLYGRKNAYSVYYAKDDDRVPGYRDQYHLYKMYILGQPIPTLTYSFAL